MSATCGNCKWWSDHGDEDWRGTCLLKLHDPAARSFFTKSYHDCADWCGEHQPKETRDE